VALWSLVCLCLVNWFWVVWFFGVGARVSSVENVELVFVRCVL